MAENQCNDSVNNCNHVSFNLQKAKLQKQFLIEKKAKKVLNFNSKRKILKITNDNVILDTKKRIYTTFDNNKQAINNEPPKKKIKTQSSNVYVYYIIYMIISMKYL